MAKTLKEQFAVIRDREEVLKEIHRKKDLLAVFDSWTEELQNLFLEYCTGELAMLFQDNEVPAILLIY